MAAASVRHPLDGHVAEHAGQGAPVGGLDRGALDAVGVDDPRHTLLAAGTQLEVVGQQLTQQLPALTLELGFEVRVLETGRLRPRQPAHDRFEPVPRRREQRRLGRLRRVCAHRPVRLRRAARRARSAAIPSSAAASSSARAAS